MVSVHQPKTGEDLAKTVHYRLWRKVRILGRRTPWISWFLRRTSRCYTQTGQCSTRRSIRSTLVLRDLRAPSCPLHEASCGATIDTWRLWTSSPVFQGYHATSYSMSRLLQATRQDFLGYGCWFSSGSFDQIHPDSWRGHMLSLLHGHTVSIGMCFKSNGSLHSPELHVRFSNLSTIILWSYSNCDAKSISTIPIKSI